MLYFREIIIIVIISIDASVVVSAPTGSGKTVIFELAIVRLLINLDNTEQSGDFKIVYSK